MMSQNRQSMKDRLMAEQDYLINTKRVGGIFRDSPPASTEA
jgi:uncharacterized membrane protein